MREVIELLCWVVINKDIQQTINLHVSFQTYTIKYFDDNKKYRTELSSIKINKSEIKSTSTGTYILPASEHYREYCVWTVIWLREAPMLMTYLVDHIVVLLA